jgi:hypothetical protein
MNYCKVMYFFTKFFLVSETSEYKPSYSQISVQQVVYTSDVIFLTPLTNEKIIYMVVKTT